MLRSRDANRREFTKLTAGFAAAVMPITAATITTDTTGVTAGEVEIPSGDFQMPGYRAMPSSGSAFPTVLVVQEIFGVHEHIRDLCRRLAKSGYFAVAPELYARQNDVSKMDNIPDIISKVVSKVPDSQVMADLDESVRWAAASGKADTKRLAITGFCWGGRIVWLYAAHNPNLKAGAAWYGHVAGAKTDLTPKNPIDLVNDLKAPVIGFYGGKDTGITQDSLDRMRTALKQVGKEAEINVYPDAGHGFNADYRPSYDEVAAKDAWAKMLVWFRKNGV
jgi:carboxymethylenebutenolidase